MPIYEYKCGQCGHTLDALQKLADDPLKDCPECETPSLKRLISAPAFRLKGGGWYETDFKSDKEKKRNLADGGADGKGSGDKPKDDKPKADKPGADKPAADSPKAAETAKSKSPAKDSSSAKTAA